MKYTREIRWLTFLLIPLVTLLTVHFIVPLSFIVQSFPLVQDTMLEQDIDMQQLSMRSLSALSQNKITDFFGKIISGQLSLISLLGMNQYKCLKINEQNFKLNNANAYAQMVQTQGNNSTTTQNQSMWFATGVEQSQSLSTGQQQLLQNYKNVEPFISPLLAASGEFVHSLAFYLVSNDSEALFLEYPSRFSEKCSNISNPVLDSIYEGTVSLSAGQVAPFLENASDGTRLLSLCTSSQLTSLTAVSCLRLNLEAVGNILMPLFKGSEDGQLKCTLLLSEGLGSSVSPLGPQVAIFFNNTDNGSFTIPQSMIFQEASALGPVFGGTPTLLNAHLYVKQQNFSSFYIGPIFINMGIPLRLVIQHRALSTSAAEGIISEVVKNLLIPILVLIVVAVFLSICILKSLLGSVDKELFDLDSRCRFIVKGDIDVHIPHHDGTKDIRQVYDQVRTINKLHRYTTQDYFSGHFSEKIRKYVQALQIIDKLGYDTGNIIQNIGQAYIYIEDLQKAKKFLKDSVANIVQKIQSQYGLLEEIAKAKNSKCSKQIPSKYRQLQIVLIRRLFKLNYVYLNELEFGRTFEKIEELDCEEKKQEQKRREEYTNQCNKYLIMLKQAFSPDFSSYSECIIMLISEAKWLADMGRIHEARVNMEKASQQLQKYSNGYDETTKLLKEKGSKYKFIRKKNKLTTHSRVHPDILKMFRDYNLAKIVQLQSSSPARYEEMVHILCSNMNSDIFTLIVIYLTIFELRRLLVELKLDTTKLESTQLFRQAIPYKTLHYGEITPQNEAALLKFAVKGHEGLQREYVFVMDCGKDYIKEDKALIKYHKDQLHHIYDKLIKKTDRVSIMKYNTNTGVTVECGLMLKETNQVFRNILDQVIKERNASNFREDGLIEAVGRAFDRIKHLRSEKVMIIAFRSINQYREQLTRISMRRKSRYSPSKIKRMQSIDSPVESHLESYCNLGTFLVKLMQEEDVRNMKMILLSSGTERREQFVQYFDLKDINRRIWRARGGINTENNVVYIISQHHKTDIDRILMCKSQDNADNSVFVL